MNFLRDLKESVVQQSKVNFELVKRVGKGEKVDDVVEDLQEKGMLPDYSRYLEESKE